MRPADISLSGAAILAITCLQAFTPTIAAFSVGFVYSDLLAHPQYHVNYLEEFEPISAIDPHLLKQGNYHHKKTVAPFGIVESKEQTLHDEQPQDQPPQESQPSSMIMTEANGQRWSCVIPPPHVKEVKENPVKTAQEIAEEDHQSIKRGLELLEPLNGLCLRTTIKWWTYEYCHKKRIRQYHAINVEGKLQPENEEQVYNMARYQAPTAQIQGTTEPEGSLQKTSPAQQTVETATELERSQDRKYLVQRWEQGDICDLTGQPRKVEVQFQCANVLQDQIHMVTEPLTCSYTMVIYTPRLCKDVAFERIPAPEANKIKCKPVVTDAYYESRLKIQQLIESGLQEAAVADATVVADGDIAVEDAVALDEAEAEAGADARSAAQEIFSLALTTEERL